MLAETPLILPAGKAKGALLRRQTSYGTLKGVDKLEDRIDVIPDREWEELIRLRLPMRPYVKSILDQDGAGSCATEQTAGVIMALRTFTRPDEPHVLLNPWSMYAHTSGGRDNGSSLDENMRFAKDRGVLPDAVWPRAEHRWNEKAPQELWDKFGCYFRVDEVFDCASVAEVGTALLKGFFVGFGWRGHSCYLVDLLDSSTALYANSWGDWGDEGFGIIRLNSINFGYGAFATRSVVDSRGLDVSTMLEYAGEAQGV